MYSIKYNSIVPDDKNKLISKEKKDPKKQEAVMINFPFTRPQLNYIHNHDLKTPLWVIELLYNYFTTNQVPDIIRTFNTKSQFIIEQKEVADDQVVNKDAKHYVHLEPLIHHCT